MAASIWHDTVPGPESIYVYFKTIYLEKHELNHFERDQNTIIGPFRSLISDHKKARETKYSAVNTSVWINLLYI